MLVTILRIRLQLTHVLNWTFQSVLLNALLTMLAAVERPVKQKEKLVATALEMVEFARTGFGDVAFMLLWKQKAAIRFVNSSRSRITLL